MNQYRLERETASSQEQLSAHLARLSLGSGVEYYNLHEVRDTLSTMLEISSSQELQATEAPSLSAIGGFGLVGRALNVYTISDVAPRVEAVHAVRATSVSGVVAFGADGFTMIRMLEVQRKPKTGLNKTAASELDKSYVFEDRDSVYAFIVEHRLRGLLAAAAPRLNDAFGGAAIKILKIAVDDEGAQTLFCLVQVAGGVEDARRSLEFFDEVWWLSHCATAAGKLNFDFEFV